MSSRQLGHTVTDPAIFRDLAAYWEDSYFKSMSALHVERPTTLTRVSEYIPEIVTFVEGIVKRGFAYEAGGSVWFDTTRFEGASGAEADAEVEAEAEVDSQGESGWKHTYAKLQPWSKGNRELLEDGEGARVRSANGNLPLLRNAADQSRVHSARLTDHIKRQAVLGRFRPVESFQARRASVAVYMGTGSTWVAHRVQCYGQCSLGPRHGRAFWRRRLGVPASRQ